MRVLALVLLALSGAAFGHPSAPAAGKMREQMEKLLDNVSFDAPDLVEKDLTIDAAYVDRMLAEIARNEDLSRYIL